MVGTQQDARLVIELAKLAAMSATTGYERSATTGYERSATNLGGVSLSADMVFGDDGGERQLGVEAGDVDAGLAVALTVSV
jgi:hypothetical protein